MEFQSFPNIQTINDYINLNKNKITVILFSADWCPQAKEIETSIKSLIDDADYKQMCFIKVNDDFIEFFEKHQVEIVPTVVFYRDNEVLDKVSGYNVKEIIEKLKFWSQHIPKPDDITFSVPSNNKNINNKLQKLINQAPFMLFMKGTVSNPQCGFSKRIVDILIQNKIKFDTFDILTDQDIREGLKKYSNWPTYPQFYANGELIGGVDIITELDKSGELKSLVAENIKVPEIIPESKISTLNVDDAIHLNERIDKLIRRAPVMVFMKGNRQNPVCKFSKALIPLLNQTGVSYQTFDILDDEEIRQGLKTYSDWPTFPQIYVNGHFIGGLDIVKELNESNQLTETLLGKIS